MRVKWYLILVLISISLVPNISQNSKFPMFQVMYYSLVRYTFRPPLQFSMEKIIFHINWTISLYSLHRLPLSLTCFAGIFFHLWLLNFFVVIRFPFDDYSFYILFFKVFKSLFIYWSNLYTHNGAQKKGIQPRYDHLKSTKEKKVQS